MDQSFIRGLEFRVFIGVLYRVQGSEVDSLEVAGTTSLCLVDMFRFPWRGLLGLLEKVLLYWYKLMHQ